jgi:hypothetical protein
MSFPRNKPALLSFIHAVLTTTAFFILLSQCANPSNPSGGPKDTIPPTLLNVSPEFASLNLDTREFTFTFDERVTADKLKQNLVISPNYEGDYSFVAKKETFTIKFEEPFLDSTTYTLNFADGITDITENNPVRNLVYVFSTGNYLDSLSITGTIVDLLSQEPQKGFTVALYTIDDTLSIFKQTPKYFAKTNEDGNYQIGYIKNDNYKLIAFQDENRNLKLDKATESYGFLSDTLRLDNNKDSLQIQTVTINADSLTILSSRPYSKYYEIRFNKPVSVTNLQYDTTKIKDINFQYQDSRKVLRFYNPGLQLKTDSTAIYYTVTDTLKMAINDTTYLKFTSETGKTEDFNLSLSPSRIPSAKDTVKFSINTTKPVTNILQDSIELNYDTLLSITPQIQTKANNTKTNITVSFPIDWKALEDSIYNKLAINNDSLLRENVILNQLNLLLKTAFLISVENDSSSLIANRLPKYNPEDFGIIKVTLTTEETNFILELIDKEQQVVASVQNNKTHIFERLTLGEYSLRAKIDLDNNGRWDPGNILTDTPPEPIIYYGKYTEVRPNFEIQIEDFSF